MRKGATGEPDAGARGRGNPGAIRSLVSEDEPKGFTRCGAIGDLWVDTDGLHYVADYKATSKKDEASLEARARPRAGTCLLQVRVAGVGACLTAR